MTLVGAYQRSSDRKRIGELRLDAPVFSAVCRGRDVLAVSQSGEVQAMSIDGMDLPATDSHSYHCA